jgi:hypothetical protein
MNAIVVKSKVGPDGVLRVTVPVGEAEANREVQVTIAPATAAAPPSMTPEAWRDFVRATAGSVTDPSFVRHDQGAYEAREDLP